MDLHKKTIWKLILLQAKVLNIFPGSIEHFSVPKFISANCLCGTVSYVSKNELWLKRLWLRLAGKSCKSCLTIGCCCVINSNGAGKFWKRANVKTKDKFHNSFISKMIWQTDSVHFQIDRVLSRSKKSSDTTFSATSELKDLLEKNSTSNIRLKISKNYWKSDISNFDPKKVAGKLRK